MQGAGRKSGLLFLAFWFRIPKPNTATHHRRAVPRTGDWQGARHQVSWSRRCDVEVQCPCVWWRKSAAPHRMKIGLFLIVDWPDESPAFLFLIRKPEKRHSRSALVLRHARVNDVPP